MQSTSRILRRTALAAVLAGALAGSSAVAANATTTADAGAPSIERAIGDGSIREATTKEKREIRRQARHAARHGGARNLRTTAAAPKKQSRWYTQLGCVNLPYGVLCGSWTGWDVSFVYEGYYGDVTLGYMTAGLWNAFVYYYG